MTRLRGLAALLATIAFVAGVPYLLVKFGNWPLSEMPSIGDARELTDTVVSDTMVFGVLTLAAWAVWAVFTLSLFVELVAAIRGSQAPRIAFAGALQRAARTLVAAIILAVSLSHSHPAALAAPPHGLPRLPARAPGAVVEVAQPRQVPVTPDPVIVGGPVQAPEAGDSAEFVTVRRGDTAWGLAERHLGDGLRWRELWELNRDRPQADGSAWTNPQVIRPGWQFALPADAPLEPVVPIAEATAAPATYVVVDGDTLSGIAAAHLGDANRYPEIFETNRDRLQPDGRRLTDPNLIVTGWNLVLPSLPVAGAPPVPTPAADTPPVEDAPVEPPVAESTGPDSAPATTVTPGSSAPPSSIASADQEAQEAPEASPTPVTTTTQSAPVVAGSVDIDDESWWAAAVPVLAGVSGATVLATALVLRLRRAQRRRLLRGTAETPTPTLVEHAVASAADVPLVRWAGQALASMVARLDVSKATRGSPVAVELSPESGIEVLWESPIPIAQAPWIAADEGWAWRLPYDPDAAVPVDSLPAALPALTTIGTREGRQLLVDLEAFGTIAVAGDAQRVEDFLRAVALELSNGDDLADSYVLSVGVEDVVTAERLMQVDATTATTRAQATYASVRATLDSAGAPSTFAYRAGADGVHLEATVVIVAASSDDSAAVTTVEARSGVAVIAAHERPDASARIEIASDGSARLEPLGVSFVAAGVPSESGTLIAELASADMDDVGHIRANGHGDPSTNGHSNPSANCHAARINGHSVNGLLAEPMPASCLEGEALRLFELPDIEADEEDADAELPSRSPLDAQFVVKVLGTPRVPDRPKLARRELILTVFLACRGGRVNATAVVDALWGGRAVESKTVSNLVGKTRTALGLLPDGTEVMLPADRRMRMKGLSPAVTTDLAMLRHLYEQAQNVPSSEAIGLLQQGLALVEGQPFDADGYDWAHHVTQDVSEANRLIEQSTEQLVNLALDRDDVETARGAVAQGLRGLPGDEVLYRLRMRVEHHAGNLTGVSTAFDELVSHLADFDTEPSPSTLELRRELLGGTRTG